MENWLNHVVAKSTAIVDWRLIGSIGQWREINSTDFNKQLSDLESKHTTINMVIHSGGGGIYEGLQLYNRSKKSKATINTDIEGLAASMASALAMAGKYRRIAKNGRMMLHQGKDAVAGSGNQLIEAGKRVNALNQDLAEIYAEAIQHKHPDRDSKWVMDNWLVEGKDKWFTAAEALEEGLVHEVYDSGMKGNPTGMSHDDLVAFYDNSLLVTEPQAIAPDDDTKNQKSKPMKKEEIILMLAKQGITFDENVNADSDDTSFMAALSAKVKELKAQASKAESLQAQIDATQSTALKAEIKAAVLDGRIAAKQEAHYEMLGEKIGHQETIAALKEIEPVGDLTPRAPKAKKDGVKGREDWSHKDWAEKDSDGLKAMMVNDPEAYEELVDKI